MGCGEARGGRGGTIEIGNAVSVEQQLIMRSQKGEILCINAMSTVSTALYVSYTHYHKEGWVVLLLIDHVSRDTCRPSDAGAQEEVPPDRRPICGEVPPLCVLGGTHWVLLPGNGGLSA